MTPSHRSELRKTLQQQRQQLISSESEYAAQQLTTRCIQNPYFINSTSIAAYLSHQGEINPMGIMQTAWKLNKNIYIPVLDPSKTRHIQFARWTPDMPLTANRYGILEHMDMGHACASHFIAPEKLDLVLLPLIGFDRQCNRLGSGGGYYDSTFAFLKDKRRPTKPLFIGLAYEFQCIDTLPVEPWDVPLDGVITEQKFYTR